jgi:UDP-N-acetylmuramate dehydrogenase
MMMKSHKILGEIRYNYNLSHLTWLKVGGPADILFKPYNDQDLSNFLIDHPNLPLTILGAGSNLIIRDGGIDGIVIKLGRNFTEIEIKDDLLSVGAGCLNYNLAQFCKVNGIKGFEFLIGIPGTVGGGIAMNAGCYGSEFKDIVISIDAIDSLGNFCTITNKDIGFVYRGNSLNQNLIVTKVNFYINKSDPQEISKIMDHISALRKSSQPISESTGGSTFANPPGHKAWELIDQAGLRGYRIGNASMSDIHCNFMINNGNATAHDMEALGEFVIEKVLKETGIMLKWEIKIIGRKN